MHGEDSKVLCEKITGKIGGGTKCGNQRGRRGGRRRRKKKKDFLLTTRGGLRKEEGEDKDQTLLPVEKWKKGGGGFEKDAKGKLNGKEKEKKTIRFVLWEEIDRKGRGGVAGGKARFSKAMRW